MHTNKLSKRAFLGTLAGVFLEYFDYTLYAFSAPHIAKLFFPTQNHTTEQLLTWSVFAISFLLRPLGAVLFGHLADRIGRRHVLIFTILIMSIATSAIGLLPSYAEAGLIAPIGLVICRILQGLAVSTEYSGSSTYLLEFKQQRRGLFSGIITAASGIGIFCASLLVLVFNAMPADVLLIDNWRLPFIIAGIIIGLLGSYLRLGLYETPSFTHAKQAKELVKFPLIKLLKQTPRTLLRNILVSGYAGIAIITIEIYLPTYLQHQLHFSKIAALQISTYLALIEAAFAIFWGAISDRIGKRTTLYIAAALMMIGCYPTILLFHGHSLLLYYFAATLLALFVGAIDGPMAAYLTSSFETNTRYTGTSISYSLGAAVIGGLSPALLVMFQHYFDTHHVLPIYLSCSALLMLIILKLLR